MPPCSDKNVPGDTELLPGTIPEYDMAAALPAEQVRRKGAVGTARDYRETVISSLYFSGISDSSSETLTMKSTL